MRAKKPGPSQHTTTVVAAVAPPIAALYVRSASDLLATGLLPGLAGVLVGAASACLLTLHRERRRTVATILISSWCVALIGSMFLPAPSETHPFFDLREPEGCLAYGFALGFGVAAVIRWVNAGSVTVRPGSRGAGHRSRCRRVACKPDAAGGRSRCSPVGRVEGLDGAP